MTQNSRFNFYVNFSNWFGMNVFSEFFFITLILFVKNTTCWCVWKSKAHQSRIRALRWGFCPRWSTIRPASHREVVVLTFIVLRSAPSVCRPPLAFAARSSSSLPLWDFRVFFFACSSRPFLPLWPALSTVPAVPRHPCNCTCVAIRLYGFIVEFSRRHSFAVLIILGKFYLWKKF